MIRALKFLDWLLFIIFSLVGLYLIMAIVLSFLSTNPQQVNCAKDRMAFIATNGVHLYIILPRAEIDHELREKIDFDNEYSYLSFGWGDKEFYTSTPEWSDLTVGTAFTALFKNSDAAMHVTSYKHQNKEWRLLPLCQQQMEVLNQYLESSFKLENDQLTEIYEVKGYSKRDRFFEANGSYTLFYTSNVWVNQGLKAMNKPTSVWSPFDFGVLHHLE